MLQSGRIAAGARAKISEASDPLSLVPPALPLAVDERGHPCDDGWRPLPATYDWYGALDPDGLAEDAAVFEGAREAR
jgi:hypothetical protein